MTPSPELQTLREEYLRGCGYRGTRGGTYRICNYGMRCECTILTDGQCPRSTSPDKWYADKVVAEAVRDERDTMQAWIACGCTGFGCEHHTRWQRANGVFVDTMRSDSERRAGGDAK